MKNATVFVKIVLALVGIALMIAGFVFVAKAELMAFHDVESFWQYMATHNVWSWEYVKQDFVGWMLVVVGGMFALASMSKTK